MRTFTLLFLGCILMGWIDVIEAQPWAPPPAPEVVEFVTWPPRRYPEEAVDAFLHHVREKQWNLATDIIVDPERNPDAEKIIGGEIEKALGTLTISHTSQLLLEMKDGNATVNVTVHATNHVGMGMVWSETLVVQQVKVKDHDLWSLLPTKPRIAYATPVDGYVQRLVNLLAYPEKMFALIQQQQSASQVKQLSLAVLQFVQDYDAVFDFAATEARGKLFPYMKDESLWTAPGAEAGAESYRFNEELAFLEMDKVRDRSKTVMFYLGKDRKFDFRYGGSSVVGYVDGHVDFIKPDEVPKLRWEP